MHSYELCSVVKSKHMTLAVHSLYLDGTCVELSQEPENGFSNGGTRSDTKLSKGKKEWLQNPWCSGQKDSTFEIQPAQPNYEGSWKACCISNRWLGVIKIATWFFESRTESSITAISEGWNIRHKLIIMEQNGIYLHKNTSVVFFGKLKRLWTKQPGAEKKRMGCKWVVHSSVKVAFGFPGALLWRV